MSTRKGAGKGGQFERDICRKLTEWWTGDPDHDVLFWRTSQSGGRATSRKKKGKETNKAHCGDISALGKKGSILTRLITFELKNGYPAATMMDLLDLPRRETLFTKFVQQAIKAMLSAKTPFWALIHHRNRREVLIYFPRSLFNALRERSVFCEPPNPSPFAWMNCKKMKICVTTFDLFLSQVSPKVIKQMRDLL